MAFPPVAGPAARTRRSEARGPWERELYRVTTPQKDVCDLTQTCRRGHDAVGNHLGAVLRRTRRVDGVEVDVHCARRRPSSAQRNDVDRSCPRDTPAPCEAAPGVRERGDGVQATAGVRRGAPRRGGRAPAPFSELHQSLRETIPSRSETAQNPKRNHPRPSFLETSHINKVKPPQHDGTPSFADCRCTSRSSPLKLSRSRRGP